MARPLSEDKRNAILDAAVEIIATHGVSAPTAQIAKKARVAEGTLFTYFANKDELLNAVYLQLKTDLGQAITTGKPADNTPARRCRRIWSGYIGWGAAHPLKYKALKQLAVSDRITDKSRRLGRECLCRISSFFDELLARSPRQAAFAMAVMGALADMTLDFIAREPKRIKQHTHAGFEAFWRAVGQG